MAVVVDVDTSALVKKSMASMASMGSEQLYKEAMEQTASCNTRLSMERKLRMPFLDSQTGVAQNHTSLWHPYVHRMPGQRHGQLYTYPCKRWKKKKHSFFSQMGSSKLSDLETGDADLHHISAVENPAHRHDDEIDLRNESQDRWYYDDIDPLSDPPDAGEIVDDNSDISDYEETIKKKKKKGPGRGRRKNMDKDGMIDDKDKPYSCEACGARYKTRPGLAYHYTHFHNGMIDDDIAPSPKIPTRASKARSAPPVPSVEPVETSKPSPNNYCDFCLGDQTENKKTNQSEDLVSCSDCGRSGHPSCLQFTDNMIVSVKKYPWQCIECKSCGLCGTSDNDDQLLFCDDCDRGYHMYCLNPPLSEPPEGNWSCHLCIEEFHGGKKPQGMN
ncbi:zinc finger protein ubi-d4 A isoform X2 [Patella vulgata]|uniref:zinc finger protein ubi-d4 A isoform X2 n=1 Tax=Patella vulgata TaxID=6465 RepID=UPI00217FF563|nr:zinc finger protein ubi-d4 A isoform X2 [Patella vulgata]